MFKYISLKNFMSFTDIDFDLCLSKKVPGHSALIYGENGAGKTNLIQSISFLKESVSTLKVKKLFTPIHQQNVLDVQPSFPDLSDFCKATRTIDCNGNMLTHYEMEIDGKNVIYEMEFSQDSLIREELRVILEKKTGVLYNIEATDGSPKVYMWKDFITDESFKKEINELIIRFWGKNSLLSILNLQYTENSKVFMDSKVHKLSDVIGFIESVHVSVNPIISQFRCDRFPFLVNLEFGTIPKNLEKALKVYEKALGRFFRRIYHSVDSVYYDIRPSGDALNYQLLFKRKMNGNTVSVPSIRESAGTRKLVNMFGTLIECCSGGVAFIDELDSGVHDKLICDLLLQILPEVDGQLVVTTHNTNLLRFVPPKNVFVIDVDSNGSKSIENIRDIKRTQRSNNNQIRYLNNAFGGVPYIGVVDLKGISAEIKEGLKDYV